MAAAHPRPGPAARVASAGPAGGRGGDRRGVAATDGRSRSWVKSPRIIRAASSGTCWRSARRSGARAWGGRRRGARHRRADRRLNTRAERPRSAHPRSGALSHERKSTELVKQEVACKALSCLLRHSGECPGVGPTEQRQNNRLFSSALPCTRRAVDRASFRQRVFTRPRPGAVIDVGKSRRMVACDRSF
jgi:hypothetical protein